MTVPCYQPPSTSPALVTVNNYQPPPTLVTVTGYTPPPTSHSQYSNGNSYESSTSYDQTRHYGGTSIVTISNSYTSDGSISPLGSDSVPISSRGSKFSRTYITHDNDVSSSGGVYLSDHAPSHDGDQDDSGEGLRLSPSTDEDPNSSSEPLAGWQSVDSSR